MMIRDSQTRDCGVEKTRKSDLAVARVLVDCEYCTTENDVVLQSSLLLYGTVQYWTVLYREYSTLAR